MYPKLKMYSAYKFGQFSNCLFQKHLLVFIPTETFHCETGKKIGFTKITFNILFETLLCYKLLITIFDI